MPILGVIVRTHPDKTADVHARLLQRPGVDIAVDPGDGRLILVIEDSADTSAAAVLGEISTWSDVLNTSLVYEYSGPDSPADAAGVEAYTDWRGGLARLAGRTAS